MCRRFHDSREQARALSLMPYAFHNTTFAVRYHVSMKAAVYHRYGPPEVVRVEEVETPNPGDNQIRVRVHASTVSSGDWRARSLEVPRGMGFAGRLIFGLFRPRQPILGTELSGIVESVGKDVITFDVGDKVFADRGTGMGAHAEYIVLDEDAPIAGIPDNLSFEEAAALCFGGTVALDFLQKHGDIQPGQRVLINGASGTTGTALVQIAKHFGAEVTAVCSTRNVDLVSELGADHVVDYTSEDFSQNGEKYDLIADTAGTAPWHRAKDSLSDTGRLLVVLGGLSDMVLAPIRSKKNGKQVISTVAGSSAERCRRLAQLAADGIYKPVIDRVYPLEEIAEAHAHVDTGGKVGSVVITMPILSA